MFGQANQNNNTSGGLFGNSTPAQPAAGGFTFGANNNQQQPSTGFSFGANNTQAQNNQPKPLFGGFGSSTTQPSQ
ncbi:nucleoporin, partial [Klebsiella pneumoniae]|nr:nucleoporin [Klebsiella pneumoniae]